VIGIFRVVLRSATDAGNEWTVLVAGAAGGPRINLKKLHVIEAMAMGGVWPLLSPPESSKP
jgi:hypothetical protein